MLGVWINYITLHGYVLATMGNNNISRISGFSRNWGNYRKWRFELKEDCKIKNAPLKDEAT